MRALPISVLMVLLGAAAAAAAPRADTRRAAALEALSACRTLTAGDQRLACYDKAAGALDAAEHDGQLVVMDREQVRSVKREAFGLSLPAFSLFTSRPGASERVDRVVYTLDHASRTGDGKWVLATTDGPVWMQTDDEPVRAEPHKGSQVAVRHGALSSFFCNIDGQRAVRCQRQR